MSVSSKITYTILSGDGSTTAFAWTFLGVTYTRDLGIYILNADGSRTAVTTNYTLDIANKTVNYPTSGTPLTADQKIVLYRKKDLVQNYGYTYGNIPNYREIEVALDKLCYQVQDASAKADRAIKVPIDSDTDSDTVYNNILSMSDNIDSAIANAATATATANNALTAVNEAIANLSTNTVTVDSVLSASSENPVQNKVIYSALSAKQGTLIAGTNITIADNVISASGSGSGIIDTALSSSSENAVQNKVVKAALDLKASSSALAAVATSGSYEDLSNKPTIPSISDKISYMYFDDIVAYDNIITYTPASAITVYNKTNNRFYIWSGSAWGAAIEPVDGVLYISKDHQCILIHDDTNDTPTCVQAGVTIEDFDQIVTYTDISNNWTPTEKVKVYNTSDNHIWKFEDSVWQDQGNARQDVFYINWSTMALYVYDSDEATMYKLAKDIDSTLSSTSTNPLENKAIYSALAAKQNTLTAGTNITITDNVISASASGSGTVDTALSSSSENAVQNQVVTGSLAPYGACNTSATTAAKTVTIANIGTTFFNGQKILVEFSFGSTANYPTLSVNGSAAYPIKQGFGTQQTRIDYPFYPPVGAIIEFYFWNNAWKYEKKVIGTNVDIANYDVTGSPSLTTGANILTFTAGSGSAYLEINRTLNPTTAFNGLVKITTPATLVAGCILGAETQYTGMAWYIDASGNLTWSGSSNGTSNDIANSASTGITLSASTTYYLRMVWDGSTYTPKYSSSTSSESSMTSGTTVSSTSALADYQTIIGSDYAGSSTSYFGGSVDLNYLNYAIDGTSNYWYWNNYNGDGTNWSEYYNDGYHVEYGHSEITTITFIDQFHDTNYNIQTTPYDQSLAGASSINVYSKSVTGATFTERYGSSSTSTSIPFDWVAKGY